MRIWRYGKRVEMEGYSLVERFLKSLITRREQHPTHSALFLSPAERLFIVRSVQPEWKPSHLAQLHLDCGCFAEAYEGFRDSRHHRKLGDVAWAMGDLDLAERHYLDVSRGAKDYRETPDRDRLIRLAFLRNDTEAFFEYFKSTGFAPDARDPDRVWVDGSRGSARPYREMLAVQWRIASAAGAEFFRRCVDFGSEEVRVGPGEDEEDEEEDPVEGFLEHLDECFGIDPEEWRAFAADPRFDDPDVGGEIMARSLPMPCRRSPVTVDAAMEAGATERARIFVETIPEVDRLVDESQDALERFRDEGREEDLRTWADRVGRLRDDPLTSDLIFVSLGHGSFEADPERMERLRQRKIEIRSTRLPLPGNDGV